MKTYCLKIKKIKRDKFSKMASIVSKKSTFSISFEDIGNAYVFKIIHS